MVVLEKITAPASRNRAAGGASVAAGKSLVVAAPSGIGTPLVAMLSLIVAGTPSSGPIGSPFCQRSVDAFAVARAPSGLNAYSALMCGSHTAICASTSSSTSDGENCRALKPAIRSTALRSCSDATLSPDDDLCMTTQGQADLNDAREHAGADGKNLVVENVTRIVHRDRTVMAEPEIRAGHDVEHVGEILAAHLRLRAGVDLTRIDHRARYFRDHFRVLFPVHQHAEGVADIGTDLDLKRGGDAGAERAHPLADQGADLVGKGAHGAAKLCLAGNYVIGRARVDLRDRQHRRLQRIDIAADDGLQRLSERHGDDDGIFRSLRHRAVRAVAVDGDVKKISSRHRRARQDRKLAMVEVGRVV